MARQEIAQAVRHIIDQGAPKAARKWHAGIRSKVQNLAVMPQAFGPAREDVGPDPIFRQFVHKSHRVIFTIEGRTVTVLRVRHTAQQNLNDFNREAN